MYRIMKKVFIRLICAVLILCALTLTLVGCSPSAKYDVYVIEMIIKDYGNITLQLDGINAPKTVGNFIDLVERDFYDGLTFHRVIEGFMIQGGCPNANGTGDGVRTIYGEFAANEYYGNHISHTEGVISMARSTPYNSASCQFFITNADATASLDGQYAAFGYVTDGMEVVHAITKATAVYGLGNDGAISDKSKHAVIEDIRIIDFYNAD